MVLFPHPALEEWPDLLVSVPRSLGAEFGLAHLDSQISLGIGQDGSDGLPVPRGHPAPLALSKLRLSHPSRGPAGPAQPLIEGDVAFRKLRGGKSRP